MADLGAGGVHIFDAAQTNQQHIALGAYPKQRRFAAAFSRFVQPLELGQKSRAIAKRQGFHLTADTVGGDDLQAGR